jgi:hypothetical protein
MYGSVDAENSGWYKFVATTAGDLSAGSLYCAVFNQTSPVGGATATSAFNITWLPMGATSDAAAMTYVGGANGVNANQVTFSDIFNVDLPTSATSGARPCGGCARKHTCRRARTSALSTQRRLLTPPAATSAARASSEKPARKAANAAATGGSSQ